MKLSDYRVYHGLALGLALALSAAAASANVAGGWVVKITNTAGDFRTTVTLGAHPDASDAYDALYDAPVFSSLTLPPLAARFPHPEWGRSDSDYLYDIRALSDKQQWSFNTESEQYLDRDIQLSWDVAALPGDYALSLTDAATGESIDMGKESSYTYYNSGPRAFTVAAVKRAQTSDAASPAASAPGAGPVSNNDAANNLASSGGGGGPLDLFTLCALLLAWPLAFARRLR